jgi:hypothetical protein
MVIHFYWHGVCMAIYALLMPRSLLALFLVDYGTLSADQVQSTFTME